MSQQLLPSSQSPQPENTCEESKVAQQPALQSESMSHLTPSTQHAPQSHPSLPLSETVTLDIAKPDPNSKNQDFDDCNLLCQYSAIKSEPLTSNDLIQDSWYKCIEKLNDGGVDLHYYVIIDNSWSMVFQDFGKCRLTQFNEYLFLLCQGLRNVAAGRTVQITRYLFNRGLHSPKQFTYNASQDAAGAEQDLYNKIKLNHTDLRSYTGIYDSIIQAIYNADIHTQATVVTVISDGTDYVSHNRVGDAEQAIKQFLNKDLQRRRVLLFLADNAPFTETCPGLITKMIRYDGSQRSEEMNDYRYYLAKEGLWSDLPSDSTTRRFLSDPEVQLPGKLSQEEIEIGSRANHTIIRETYNALLSTCTDPSHVYVLFSEELTNQHLQIFESRQDDEKQSEDMTPIAVKTRYDKFLQSLGNYKKEPQYYRYEQEFCSLPNRGHRVELNNPHFHSVANDAYKDEEVDTTNNDLGLQGWRLISVDARQGEKKAIKNKRKNSN